MKRKKKRKDKETGWINTKMLEERLGGLYEKKEKRDARHIS